MLCDWDLSIEARNYWDCTDVRNLFPLSCNMKPSYNVNVSVLFFDLCLIPVQFLLYPGQSTFLDEVIMWKNLLAVNHPVVFNVTNLIICQQQLITLPPYIPLTFTISMPLRIIYVDISQLIRNVNTPHVIITIVYNIQTVELHW